MMKYRRTPQRSHVSKDFKEITFLAQVEPTCVLTSGKTTSVALQQAMLKKKEFAWNLWCDGHHEDTTSVSSEDDDDSTRHTATDKTTHISLILMT